MRFEYKRADTTTIKTVPLVFSIHDFHRQLALPNLVAT